MTVGKAHITWTATALGAAFAATYVQRLHTTGWFDIASSTTEATAAFDDYEHKRSVEEQWRVLVEDIYGFRSVAPSAVTLTAAVPETFLIVSNENPAINQALYVEYPLTPSFPERVTVTPTTGRYGQRLHRSSDRWGETFPLSADLFGANGPALWRTLVDTLRSDLPYICLLDMWGNRWFAGFLPQSADLPFFSRAKLAVNLVEVTDTPTVVSF